jgi:hypothetical protein
MALTTTTRTFSPYVGDRRVWLEGSQGSDGSPLGIGEVGGIRFSYSSLWPTLEPTFSHSL